MSRIRIIVQFLFLLTIAASFSSSARAQASLAWQPNFSEAIATPQSPRVSAWGDYDNDGKLDLISYGRQLNNAPGITAVLLHNDGAGAFHQVPFPGWFTSWVDFDNDGFLDVFARTNNLWHNQHNGTFTNRPIPGVTNLIEPLDLMWGLKWFDYNNDGRSDLIYPSTVVGTPSVTTLRLLRNLGGGNFAEVLSLPAGEMIVEAADMNSDGWIDLIYTTRTNNTVYLQIALNNALDPLKPLFTPLSVPIASFGYDFNGIQAADFNNDGRLDLITVPDGYRVFLNRGNNTFSEAFSAINFFFGGTPLANPADYNNDGWIDFAAWATQTGPGETNRIYQNLGNEQFGSQLVTDWYTPNKDSFGDTHAAWGDYDNDGRIDLFAGARTNRLFKNTTTISNTPPTAPGALASAVGSNWVVLSWQPAADAQTPTPGLSYNLRVGTAPGTADIVNPSADLTTGWRRIVQRGPIQPTTYRLHDLPPGIYYWSVQAIDGAYAGGAFAPEQTFVIPGLGIKPAWVLNVTSNSAVLFASILRNGAASGYFEWGLTADFGNQTPVQDLSGNGERTFHAALTSLDPGQYYYFRAVLTNSLYTLRTGTVSFHTDPLAVLGDTNGDGQLGSTEAQALLTRYLTSANTILTNPASLGGGNFQMDVQPILPWPFHLQVSSDLVNWSNVAPTGTVLFRFSDPQATNSAQRFYRFR